MQRFTTFIISLTIGLGSALGGQIEVGSGTNGVNGLTNSYILSGCVGSSCTAGSIGNTTERGYDSRLFMAATLSGTIEPLYTTGTYNPTSASAGTLVDSQNNVTFAMINDGTGSGGYSNNFWDLGAVGNQPSTVTIPIGVADVSQVWTVLNNIWGTAGSSSDTEVEFDFYNTTNGASSQIYQLTNASNTTPNTGQIGTSVDCTTTVAASCNSYAIESLSPSGTLTSTDTLNQVKYVTNTLYEQSYSNAGGNFAGSAGVLTLDDQGFFLDNASPNTYLVDIKVIEESGAGATGPGLGSQTALSAVTIDTAPEPSTILLVLAGFGAIGASRIRRRA